MFVCEFIAKTFNKPTRENTSNFYNELHETRERAKIFKLAPSQE